MGGSPEREYLLDNLAAVLTEAVGTPEGTLDSDGITPYSDGIRVLVYFGRMVITQDVGNRVIASWREHPEP